MYDPRENRIIKESAFTRWIGTFAPDNIFFSITTWYIFHRPTCLVDPPRFFWELCHHLSHFPTLQELNSYYPSSSDVFQWWTSFWINSYNFGGRIFHGYIITTDFRSCIASLVIRIQDLRTTAIELEIYAPFWQIYHMIRMYICMKSRELSVFRNTHSCSKSKW